MESTVIRFSNEKDNLDAIFDETRKTAAYADLDKKKTLRLRLLSEELVGMLKELTGNFEGEFWTEVEDLTIQLITRIYVMDEMDDNTDKAMLKELKNIKEAEVVENKKTGTKITRISARDIKKKRR